MGAGSPFMKGMYLGSLIIDWDMAIVQTAALLRYVKHVLPLAGQLYSELLCCGACQALANRDQ